MVRLLVTASSPYRLNINWLPPLVSNGIVSSYSLYYRELKHGDCPDDPGPWFAMNWLHPDETNITITDLPTFSKYQVKVMPWTMMGRGQVAEAEGITDAKG